MSFWRRKKTRGFDIPPLDDTTLPPPAERILVRYSAVDYPPFSHYRRAECPKCGSDQPASIQYVEASSHALPPTFGTGGIRWEYDEHIRRTCSCGWWWKERTADWKPDEEAA